MAEARLETPSFGGAFRELFSLGGTECVWLWMQRDPWEKWGSADLGSTVIQDSISFSSDHNEGSCISRFSASETLC